jgi:hypothetical protein
MPFDVGEDIFCAREVALQAELRAIAELRAEKSRGFADARLRRVVLVILEQLHTGHRVVIGIAGFQAAHFAGHAADRRTTTTQAGGRQ